MELEQLEAVLRLAREYNLAYLKTETDGVPVEAYFHAPPLAFPEMPSMPKPDAPLPGSEPKRKINPLFAQL